MSVPYRVDMAGDLDACGETADMDDVRSQLNRALHFTRSGRNETRIISEERITLSYAESFYRGNESLENLLVDVDGQSAQVGNVMDSFYDDLDYEARGTRRHNLALMAQMRDLLVWAHHGLDRALSQHGYIPPAR